jgi:hypothetical protein
MAFLVDQLDFEEIFPRVRWIFDPAVLFGLISLHSRVCREMFAGEAAGKLGFWYRYFGRQLVQLCVQAVLAPGRSFDFNREFEYESRLLKELVDFFFMQPALAKFCALLFERPGTRGVVEIDLP